MAEAVAQWDLVHPPGLLGAPRSALGEVKPGDLALCGYFCDNLDGGPPGARFLARQIRYFSQPASAHEGVHDLDDFNVFPLEPEKHKAAIFRQLDKIAAAGGVPILVGGDRSGLSILEQHVAARLGCRPVVCRTGMQHLHQLQGAPWILALDLSDWPFPGTATIGASYDRSRLLDHLDALPGPAVGAAIFGLAPALDWSGAAETRLARDLLASVVAILAKGPADAAP